jgi:ribosomal protein S27AE
MTIKTTLTEGWRTYTCVECGKFVRVAAWIEGDTCGECKFTAYLRNGGYDD